MSVSRKKLLFTAASAMIALAAIQPLSAQTIALGGDGHTRVLWRGTDSRISLWILDGLLPPGQGHSIFKEWEKIDGWLPIAVTAADTITYLLWRNTDGTASIWKLDSALNLVKSQTYGPFPGFTAVTLSTNGDGDALRLMWRHTNGLISLWLVTTNLDPYPKDFNNFGPLFGYDAGPP
jgi:hypothetical protein